MGTHVMLCSQPLCFLSSQRGFLQRRRRVRRGALVWHGNRRAQCGAPHTLPSPILSFIPHFPTGPFQTHSLCVLCHTQPRPFVRTPSRKHGRTSAMKGGPGPTEEFEAGSALVWCDISPWRKPATAVDGKEEVCTRSNQHAPMVGRLGVRRQSRRGENRFPPASIHQTHNSSTHAVGRQRYHARQARCTFVAWASQGGAQSLRHNGLARCTIDGPTH